MLDEIKKSVNEIIYERTTSPFYGSFIFSWVVWNWEIFYLTIFVSEEKINQNKLDYIKECYLNIDQLFLYPICSTIIIITLLPFVTNGSYWLSLKFNKWRTNKKNEVDNKVLLTLEQSIALRTEISNMEESFKKLLDSKELEIKQISIQNQELSKTVNDFKELEKKRQSEKVRETKKPTNQSSNEVTTFRPVRIVQDELENSEIESLKIRLKRNKSEMEQFEQLIKLIQEGYAIRNENVESKFISLIEANELIENTGKQGLYQMTPKGKKFLKQLL